jgi:hypothetical protein
MFQMNTSRLVEAMLRYNDGSLPKTLQSMCRMYDLHRHELDLDTKMLDTFIEAAVVLSTGQPSLTLNVTDLPHAVLMRLEEGYVLRSSNPFWQTCPVGAKLLMTSKDFASHTQTARVIDIDNSPEFDSYYDEVLDPNGSTDPDDVYRVTFKTIHD